MFMYNIMRDSDRLYKEKIDLIQEVLRVLEINSIFDSINDIYMFPFLRPQEYANWIIDNKTQP